MSFSTPARACGIDFGTSNSTVGWLRPGQDSLLPLEDGKITLPSVIFFNTEERRPVYGRLALHEYLEGYEGRLMRSLKSLLGSKLLKSETTVLGSALPFKDLLGFFIGELKKRAETQAERAFEEGGMAIQIAARDCRQQVTEQPAGELGSEQHRNLAGRHRPCAKSADRTLGSAPANTRGFSQQLALAIDVIPVVALHLPLAFGDHHAAQAVAGAGITTNETMTVAINAATLMGVETRAISVLDPGVGGECCRLAGQRLLHCLLRRDRPGVIEV